jgi:hypothetical protein
MPAATMATCNVPQAKFLSLPHKYRAFVAGFGSGKTWVGTMAVCRHAWEFPKVRQGYFAPTYGHIRDIFYPTIDEVARDFGLRATINKGDKEVHLYNKSKYKTTIICRSMDAPESIIGFKIGHAMVDELDTIVPAKAMHAWRKIIARLRWQGAHNGADVTTTPEGFRFVYQQWVEALAKKPELSTLYGMVQASTYDNEANLNPDYIESLVQTYPAELISAYLNGQFVNLTSGTVYYAYKRDRHRSLETVTPGEPLRLGMDFNVGRMVAVVYVMRNGDEWHAVDEFIDVYDTPAMVEAIKSRYPGHAIRVYPDPAGKGRHTTNASTSDHALLEQAGFLVYAHDAHALVKDRVLSTNVAINKGKVYINDYQCPTVSRCLEQQSYDANGAPDKKGGFDHATDAATYPIEFEMPVIKPASNVKIGFSY